MSQGATRQPVPVPVPPPAPTASFGRLHQRLPLAACAALGVLTAAVCSDSEPIPDGPGACGEVVKDLPSEYHRDLDVLFVIDNSASMAEEQAALLASFDRFIAVLEDLPGGLPNIHIGVISTDLGAGPDTRAGCTPGGDGGRLQSTPRWDCEGPTDAFISDLANRDGTRTRNYEGDIADAFSCIAALGIDGCEFEQPLEAVRRALDGSVPENDGFLRESAFLFLVFVTDEDDCSASKATLFDPDATALGPLTSFRCFEYGVACEPDFPRVPGLRAGCMPRGDSPYVVHPDAYVAFLEELKQGPWMLASAGIVGELEPVEVGVDTERNPALLPSCGSPTADATPAVRLAYFHEQLSFEKTSTICSDDLSDAAALIAELTAQTMIYPCVVGAIDLDLDAPGLQVDCTVSELRFPDTDQQDETLVQPCLDVPPAPGTMPCWELIVDPYGCPDTVTHAVLRVYRSGADVPAGTHTVMRCSTGCVAL